MPKIEHIIGNGPELAVSQKMVLKVLEDHPDQLFRMCNEDIKQIQILMSNPEGIKNSNPVFTYKADGEYSKGTVKWALSTLLERGKIGSIELHRRKYYGSHDAIKYAQEMKEAAKK